MRKKDANQLNHYIDDPKRHPAPDAETARVVEQLQQQAAQVEPRPQFVNKLSAQLQAKPRPQNSARTRADWLIMRFVPRVVGATAVVGLIALLAWGVPTLWQQWRTLEPEPAVSGDAVEITERTTTDPAEIFPEVPAELPLYHIEQLPIPTTPEQALAWAADFGLPDPKVYTDPRQPEAGFQVIGSSNEVLTFQPHGPASIYYAIGQEVIMGYQTASSESDPLPFTDAAAAAVNFLTTHNLLPESYQVTEDAPDRLLPYRRIAIVPDLNGYPLAGNYGAPYAQIHVDPDGTVIYAEFRFATFTPGNLTAVRPAQAAYDAYLQGDIQSLGMEARMDESVVNMAIRHFAAPPPVVQVGDVITLTGWVNLMVAADDSDIKATLHGRLPGTYHLTGDKLLEMTGTTPPGEVTVQGTVTAVWDEGAYQIEITDWELARSSYSSFSDYTCLKGTFSREGEEGWIITDDTLRYRLPQAPAELHDGDRIEVCGQPPSADNVDLAWNDISQPPASEVPPLSEGGMSMTTVQVATVVEDITSTTEVGSVMVEHNVTFSGGGGGGGYLLPADAPEAQYEVGETVVITGTVEALIFAETDGSQRAQILLQPLNDVGLVEGSLALEAEPEVLAEIADYHGRFLTVSGVITEVEAGFGRALEVQTFRPVWPAARPQNFLGHIKLEVIDGVDTAVFVDHATDQGYIIAWKDVYYRENDDMVRQPQILVSGLIHPEQDVAGHPILIIRSSLYDSYIAQAKDVSEFPLEEEPPLIPYVPTDPLDTLADMVLERMELVYYWQPAYDSGPPTGLYELPPLLPEQVVKPVWVIHGRSPDGLTIFKVYIEATGD